jgi:hypothetical protein
MIFNKIEVYKYEIEVKKICLVTYCLVYQRHKSTLYFFQDVLEYILDSLCYHSPNLNSIVRHWTADCLFCSW